MAKYKFVHKPIYENLDDWPVSKASKQRADLVNELSKIVFENIKDRYGNDSNNLIAQTLYKEKTRIKEEPWKVDPPDDKAFWKKVQKNLTDKSLDQNHPDAVESNDDIIKQIIHRYAEEIVGTFNNKRFKFARKFLTILFSRLLNTAANRNIQRLYRTQYELHDRMRASGEIELIREIFPKGNVVIVPTHFSNLDSILIGYVLDSILGLPAFSYGAGLNLYNSGLAAYYMNRLGAYRVDRRKKNIIYLETLKGLVRLMNQKGINNIFFPGGTRSRSGAIESQLKLGLLSTLISAQRELVANGSDRKIIVVPITMSYHFTLEAKHLIYQHLKKHGQENFLLPAKQDASLKIKSIIKFIWEFFSDSSEIIVSVGRPMDVLGNFLDKDVISYDKEGHPIDIKDYFVHNGVVTKNKQRESIYTKKLAEQIIRRFHEENIVLTSHLVAFSVFLILKHKHPRLDLYGLLRIPTDDIDFPINLVVDTVIIILDKLKIMKADGQVKLAKKLDLQPLEIIHDGIKKLGKFHTKKPLSLSKTGDLYSRDFVLLHYYHNRLTGFGLEKDIPWRTLFNKHKDIFRE